MIYDFHVSYHKLFICFSREISVNCFAIYANFLNYKINGKLEILIKDLLPIDNDKFG